MGNCSFFTGRGSLLVLLVGLVGAALTSCSESGSTRAKVAGRCTLNSDCAEGLVCTLGLCHVECKATRDCEHGQRCTRVGDTSVCQLEVEATCAGGAGCTAPLSCASDGECRSSCAAPGDCTTGQVCAETGVCAETTEVDATGALKGASRDGGTGGSPGVDGGAGGPGTGGTGGTGAGGESSAGGATGSGGTGDGAGGALGAGGAPGCGLTVSTNCETCLDTACCAEQLSCAAETFCRDAQTCHQNCESGNVNCHAWCEYDATSAMTSLNRCFANSCALSCVPTRALSVEASGLSGSLGLKASTGDSTVLLGDDTWSVAPPTPQGGEYTVEISQDGGNTCVLHDPVGIVGTTAVNVKVGCGLAFPAWNYSVDENNRVLALPDGGFAVLVVEKGTYKGGLYSVDSTGAARAGFGTGGFAATAVYQPTSLARRTDGGIYVVGNDSSSYPKAQIELLTATGQPDGTWATNPRTFEMYPGIGWTQVLGATADGNDLFVLVTANDGTNDKIGVLKITAAGALDTTFGTGGRRLTTLDRIGNRAAFAKQGNSLLIGAGDDRTIFVEPLERIDLAGKTDAAFVGVDQILNQVDDLIVLSDGLLVSGFAARYTDRQYAGWETGLLVRLDTNGNATKVVSAARYPTAPYQTGYTRTLLTQDSQGKVLAYGSTTDGNAVYVARFDTDLNRDTTFGKDGTVSLGFGPGQAKMVGVLPNATGVGVLATNGTALEFATAVP